MSEVVGPTGQQYIDGVVAKVEVDLGRPLGDGTTIVPAADREGSRSAVGYFLPGRTAIWCDPVVADRLAPLAGSDVLTVEQFLAQAGGEPVGVGNNRIAENAPADVGADTADLRVQWLDRDEPTDVALLAALRTQVSDDDADEAELDLDDLDPAIAAFIDDTDATSTIAAYAGARPSELHEGFDDIAVLTHPAFRRRNLGAAIVGLFSAHRQGEGRHIMYRCDVENLGSNALSSKLGFPLVHQVAAVRFAE